MTLPEHPYEKEGGWGGERMALDLEEGEAAPCESWGCCHACETCDRYCSFDDASLGRQRKGTSK